MPDFTAAAILGPESLPSRVHQQYRRPLDRPSGAPGSVRQRYLDQGFALLESSVDGPSLEMLCRIQEHPSAHQVLEDDGLTLRSVYGFHRQPAFRLWLSHQAWLRDLLHELLETEVYLYQSKINLKNRLASSVWPFHRDFPFWREFDGVPDCRMVNVAIHLDDVTPDCGPLKLLPASHQAFLAREAHGTQPQYSLKASAGADLAFSFSDEEVSDMRQRFGEVSVEGARGSALVFHPQIVHGSDASIRNRSRRVMLLTFNACDNRPTRPQARPEFLCERDFSPVAWRA